MIETDFLDNAVNVIEFAIEEFGRPVYLRERLHKGLEAIEDANYFPKGHFLTAKETISPYTALIPFLHPMTRKLKFGRVD